MLTQHSSRSDSWHTPQDIIDRVHKVLGNIDLDPASDVYANARIGARHFYTREQDGLAVDWIRGSVFLNPPGGKRGNKSLSALFWKKLMEHRDSRKLTHAIFMAFSIEQLAVTQGYGCIALGEFPLVIPAKRIQFVKLDGSPGGAPSHANCIAYVPGTTDNTPEFLDAFEDLGTFMNRV
jgi:hypothetical protein